MKTKGKILIIDDDEYILLSVKLLLDQHYETVVPLGDPNKVEEVFTEHDFQVVLLDMNFKQGETSGAEGIQWLKKIKELNNQCSILLMTAYGEVSVAVNAMKEGANDFIVKPWQNEKLLASVKTAFDLSAEKRNVEQLKSREKILSASIDSDFSDIIGQSQTIKDVIKVIQKVASTDADVLILGENGTGKEVAARAIHRNSNRAKEVFISVDLGSLSENLFESELFGHKKGAFTDAKEDRIGRFEAAAGGTLFLDEIGNLPLALQAKLLTVLQHRKITRLGTNESIDLDVRVICATNGNLRQMVKEGDFREDLLYRINTVEVLIPPLRDRPGDIPLLAEHFINRFNRKYHKEGLGIESQVSDALKKYPWPGNVRELQHAIERAVIMSDNNRLKTEDFRFLSSPEESNDSFDDYNLETIEAWAIKKAVKKHNGNISHAAKELGLSRGAMYRRMEKYGI
ncbi:MAG: sigma-54 dependent transcriptional regulator [Bacteroidota bacterium]